MQVFVFRQDFPKSKSRVEPIKVFLLISHKLAYFIFISLFTIMFIIFI